MRRLAIAVLLLLGGCFELTTNADVKPDGSVVAEVEVAVSAQLAAMASALSKDPSQGDLLANCGSERRLEAAPDHIKVVKVSRGTRGDMMTCTAVIEIKDPVAAAKSFKPEDAIKKDGLVFERVSVERLTPGSYRVNAVVQAKPPADVPTDNKTADAMMMAMVANRNITLTIRSKQITNTTGELSADGTAATWKIPVMVMMKPPPGYRQEVKADVTFEESTFDKVRRWLGFQ